MDASLKTFEQSTFVPAAIEDVFAFFSVAGNLSKLTPPLIGFEILTPKPIEMRVGTMIDYRIRLRGVPMTWRSEITVWEPGSRFVDEQRKGPYKSWIHTHTFESVPGGTNMSDHLEYELPLGVLGNLVHGLVRRDIEKIFAYRRQAIDSIFPAS